MKLTPPFITATIVSMAIHAAVVVPSYSNNILLPGSTGSIIAVKLEEKKDNLVNPETKKTSDKKTYIKPEAESKQTAQKKQNKLVTMSAASAYTAENITHKVANKNKIQQQKKKSHAESKAKVASIIYKELKQHFTYPKLAVYRNWQGKVLLSLRVTPAGHIKKIQLTKSSGYNLLDQAAIESLSMIKNLPHTSTWLKTDIELKLPIIYKLTEG